LRTFYRNLISESRSQTWRLYYLTDLHIGARACDEGLLRKQIQQIADDPFARWIGGGDYIDCIARKGDKRYRESTLAPWLWGRDDAIGTQRDYMVAMLEPIIDKCLGLGCGNHEFAARNYIDRDIYGEIVAWLAQKQGVDPWELKLGVQGFVCIRFKRAYSNGDMGGTQTFRVYCHHGYGGGRLPGGDALALARVLGDYECDLALMGHRHKQQILPKQIVAPSATHGGVARMQTRMALFCGHWLNEYIIPAKDGALDTYAEEIGLPPAPTGTPEITIKPDERTMTARLQFEVGNREFKPDALPKKLPDLWIPAATSAAAM
jgi:hypothetical protein